MMFSLIHHAKGSNTRQLIGRNTVASALIRNLACEELSIQLHCRATDPTGTSRVDVQTSVTANGLVV
eukprot:1960656-Amphidinium_carterae.1